MLEAIKLNKAFDHKPVIQDFSMAFEPGGRYALMGPSGCGKTTLLRLLAGLLKPDSGEVRGLGKPSAVFQENRLLDHLTASANVRLVSAAEAQAVTAMLLRLGLDPESLSKPVGEFSGGMKRRVALCRALMADYDVLFLDEPYKGLDGETKAAVMAVVDEAAKGKTVILVTHDRGEAEGYQVMELG